MTTLKDIVRENEPEKICKKTDGGVIGCPRHYKYLHRYLSKDEINSGECPMPQSNTMCYRCWNRRTDNVKVETEHAWATLFSWRKDELVDRVIYLECNNNLLNEMLNQRAGEVIKVEDDLQSVVYCKDCRYWKQDIDENYCDNPNGLATARADDFCSNGERKGGK